MAKNDLQKEKSWDLVNTEMAQAYEEHRAAGQRALNVIKQWLLVTAFPFIVIGSSISFINQMKTQLDITEDWFFSLPIGYRPFFVFSSIMGMLLIFLHNDIDIHKHVCRNGMNSFRKLYKSTLKEDFNSIGWEYKMRTDFTPIRLNPSSFTFWFAIFGGCISGLYCSIGIGSGLLLSIILTLLGVLTPQAVMIIKLAKENKKHNS
jgi:hypothetical protein